MRSPRADEIRLAAEGRKLSLMWRTDAGQQELIRKLAQNLIKLQIQLKAAQAALLTCGIRQMELKGALRPFAHEDLCKDTSNTLQGDDSPVFGRDKAILTLGDFRLARRLIRDDL